MADSTSSLAASSNADVGSSSRERERRISQGASHGNPLSFASGEIGDVAPGVIFEANLGQQFSDGFGRQSLSALGRAEAEIVRHGAGKQKWPLRHHAKFAAQFPRLDIPIVGALDKHRADVGSSRRFSKRSSEVLPEPLGPVMARTSPFCNSKFASSIRILSWTVRPRCSVRRTTSVIRRGAHVFSS